MAWLTGQDKVSLDHILQVAPYVLWHRLKWTDDIKSKLRDDNRDDPFDLYITKTLLGERMGVYINQFQSKEMYPISVVCAIVKNEK